MKEKSFLEKPIPRGRTKKERIAIMQRIIAEVRADPGLRAAIKRWTKAMTH